MDVILTKDVEYLGRCSDVISVKEGYARNFLLPRGLAVVSTPQNLKIIERQKRCVLVRENKLKEEMGQLADELSRASCTIAVNAGEDDKIFGSVTPEDVEEALKQEGFSIDKKKIFIEEPIRSLGVYHVTVKLSHESSPHVRVWVVKK